MDICENWDKWDYLEILYRSLIVLMVTGTSAFFLVQMVYAIVALFPDHPFIVYLITSLLFFGWVLMAIGVCAWVIFIAKGTFRPKEELPADGEDLEDIT